MICKCCGKEAQWCGDGYGDFGPHSCDDIHCTHCGMHYSLEIIDGVENPDTFERAKELMLNTYNGVQGAS